MTEGSIDNLCHSETSDRCHWSWESVSFLDSSMFYVLCKENGLPRRFAPRNDRGVLAGRVDFGSVAYPPNTISPKSSGRWNAGTALVTGFHAR